MRKAQIFALACFGALAFATLSNSAPISAAGAALGSAATRTAIDQALPDATVQDVRWRRGRHWGWHPRHYGWYRGHHYGWRHHRYYNYGFYPHRRVYYW